jgi:DNA-binding transcriptional regulator WhiA
MEVVVLNQDRKNMDMVEYHHISGYNFQIIPHRGKRCMNIKRWHPIVSLLFRIIATW